VPVAADKLGTGAASPHEIKSQPTKDFDDRRKRLVAVSQINQD
jgi:hypothetical protein